MIVPQKNTIIRAPEVNHNDFQLMSEKEKLKASNFGATLLRIGSWQVGTLTICNTLIQSG